MTDKPSDPGNIVRSPIIRSVVDSASRLAYYIALFRTTTEGEERQIGSGTGFFHRRNGHDFLVTCWHVASGRNPTKPGTFLPGYTVEPTSFRVHVPLQSNPHQYVILPPIPLYTDSGEPRWIEGAFVGGTGTKEVIDLAAIPMPVNLSGGEHPLLISRIEDAPWRENNYLRVGRDIVIVGYPFGMRPENPFPIWKRGFIASEPSLLINGMAKYYVDSPGRPGMSGAPMFMISPGQGISKKTHDLFEDKSLSALERLGQIDVEELINAPEVNMMQFAGVYAGSFGEGVEQMRLGIGWHAAMVDRLFTHPVAGSTHLDD